MKMSMSGQMRLEQRMKLAPRMIQSMEVLQLPLLALQEKIEAELNSNPVLEVAEEAEDRQDQQAKDDAASAENVEYQELVVDDGADNAEDFQRLDNIGDTFDDYMERASTFRKPSGGGDTDRKQEALQNTAAPSQSLTDYLIEQWHLVEAEDKVKAAGEQIINYIDEKGFLSVHLEQLYNKDRHDFEVDDLRKALVLVQKLDPTGVGAKDLRECLLLQMDVFPDDMSFEYEMVSKHWDELLDNHLPQIAKKMKCSVQRINEAIAHMSKLDTSPGLQVGRVENFPITADVTVTDDEQGGYIISLADANMPNLQVNDFYSSMSRDRKLDTKTRDFLQQNIRSAQWLMDAISQRRNTLLNVATAVVEYQKEFFEKGSSHLRPLPMAVIAEKVGIHIATVSRAVAGKYLQCSQGIVPLRSFFSGGMEDSDGNMQSWDAVRAKVQQIVDQEDKSKPLTDDQIKKALAEAGVGDIARRTVAKYRKLLNIPTARFRKKF